MSAFSSLSRAFKAVSCGFTFSLMGMILTLFLPSEGLAATPLVDYQAAQGLPSSTHWAGASSASFSSHVTAELIQDAGLQVLRIYDPGIARDDNSTPKVAANWNYTRTLSSQQHVEAVTLGWSMKATLKLPSFESGFTGGDATAAAWGVDSNHWFGYYMDDVVWDAGQSKYVKGTDRYLFALTFGRNAAGQTVVLPYRMGASFEKVLSGDYHTYEMLYRPETHSASVYVDGEFWLNYSVARSDVATSDTRYMYWGDNNSQDRASSARATYWDSVSFTIVPEPVPTTLLLLGLGSIMLRRRRLSTLHS